MLVRIAAAIGLLLRRVSGAAHGWIALTLVLEVAARLLVVATALLVAEGGLASTAVGAVVTALVFAALRAAQAFAKVRVERDVYATTVRSVLGGDVLAVPTADVRRVAFEGTYSAIELVAQRTPALVADGIASIAVVPLVVTTLPPRVLVLGVVALGVVGAVALALRVAAQRMEERAALAHQRVVETLFASIEDRLAIVARAGEDELERAYAEELAQFESRVRRSGVATTLLGRAPLAAGALAILGVVAVDAASRHALEGAVLAQTLVLVACVPPVHGALLALHGMVRAFVYVRPFVELLRASPRNERGGREVSLPVTVRGEDVTFGYGSTTVLAGLSFVWRPGEPLVVMGPNGSGKSTLFKLLLGLRPLASGRLWYGEDDLATVDVRALRRNIAYLPQRPYLGEPHATLAAALRLGARDATDATLEGALARVDLAKELGTPVGELSAGQRQRAALARLLLQNAHIVLLDEPDADLDRPGIEQVVALVRALAAEGKLVAVAAHGAELAALAATPLVLPASRAVRD